MSDSTCLADNCAGHPTRRGMCSRHYTRWLNYGSTELPANAVACAVEGCSRELQSQGFCRIHLRRIKNHGDPGPVGRLHAEDGAGHLRADGYTQEKISSHPLANRSGYVYRHRQVLYDAIGEGPHACHWCGKMCEWHAEARSERLTADHLDWDRRNNDPANLVPSCLPCNSRRFETRTDRGSTNPGAKLTEDQVLAIRAASEAHQVLAARYGVSQSLISLIRSRKIWAWLDEGASPRQWRLTP